MASTEKLTNCAAVSSPARFPRSARLLALALVLCAFAAPFPVYGHTLFDFAADTPKEGWRLNMWGKREDGTKGTAEIAIVDAPNGARALQATITDSAGCSVISPPIADGAWRQAAYEGIEITYRGDGSSRRIPLYLSGPGEKGKAARRTRFMLSLNQKGWRTLVVPAPKPVKGKPALQLNTITSLYFACRSTFTFSVSSVRLLTKDDFRKIEEAKPAE